MADLFAHSAERDDSPTDDPVLDIVRQIEAMRRDVDSLTSTAGARPAPHDQTRQQSATMNESSGEATIARPRS